MHAPCKPHAHLMHASCTPHASLVHASQVLYQLIHIPSQRFPFLMKKISITGDEKCREQSVKEKDNMRWGGAAEEASGPQWESG